MFSQACVKDSVHRGVYPSMHWGRHPDPGRHPPSPTDTAADGTHPTGMHSCLVISSINYL